MSEQTSYLTFLLGGNAELLWRNLPAWERERLSALRDELMRESLLSS